MFTGIIQTIGHLQEVISVGDDRIIQVQCPSLNMQDVIIGDSIAVNGVCLTAVEINPVSFKAHISRATLNATTGFDDGQKTVNLEKALRLNDRLGGHLVSGHVDGIGEIINFEALGDCWKLDIRAPHDISKFIAKKGSIAVHGISLTVNYVEGDVFSMNIIPHTLSQTNLQHLTQASLVNLEVDQIARYVDRMQTWQVEDQQQLKHSTD